MGPCTLCGVNRLPDEEKREMYARLVPDELRQRYGLDASLKDAQGRDLLDLDCPAGSSMAEASLYHQAGFRDPILYGQIGDTINGLAHVFLYVLNDPDSPRFDTDVLPDGRATHFGTRYRNIAAEIGALQAGLSPGQVRRGLGLLGPAIRAFEAFVASLGHDMFFAEPLFYHNAVIFEHYGFAYERGRKLMERVQAGFCPDGALARRLDCSSPFRMPEAAGHVRLRSWALHDGLLGEPFTNVTMYKRVGKLAGLNTCPGCSW